MGKIAQFTAVNDTRIVIWETSESTETLLLEAQLSAKHFLKFQSLRPKQGIEYLGLRLCLQALGLNVDVYYDDKGKPYINDTRHISITHSYGKVAVAISAKPIGIDIEKARSKKILNIERKFIRIEEKEWIPTERKVEYLHIIWGIKEGLYKLNGGNLWNFLHHYYVDEFKLIEDEPIYCWITDSVKSKKYKAFYKMIDSFYFICVLDDYSK